MFEDIKDPSRDSPTRSFRWGSLSFVFPADSFEASWNIRLFSGLLCVLVALNAVTEYRNPPVALVLRDALFVALFVLVWIFRSRALAALACVLTPLLLLVPETNPNQYSVPAARHAFRFFAVVLLLGLDVAWTCFRFHRFEAREAALSPDSPDGARPV